MEHSQKKNAKAVKMFASAHQGVAYTQSGTNVGAVGKTGTNQWRTNVYNLSPIKGYDRHALRKLFSPGTTNRDKRVIKLTKPEL